MIRKKIIARRKELGFTQKKVAELAGVRKATISEFETGKSNLSSHLLEKVMKVLDLTIYASLVSDCECENGTESAAFKCDDCGEFMGWI